MRLKIVLIACSLFISLNSFARQQSMPGRVLIRIKPEGVSAFRRAFAIPETRRANFDPQKFDLKDKNSIHDLFSLRAALNFISIKPLIPQHNVVLEDLRGQTNALLFQTLNQFGAKVIETENLKQLRLSEEKISRWFELFYEGSLDPEAVSAIMMKSNLVECAEPRYLYGLCYSPNDSLFGQQYALPLIHAPEAWDIVRCDSTMLVADDDIGTDWTHPDLVNAIFINKGETGLDADGFDKRSNGIDDDGDGFVDDWHGWDFAGVDGTAPDNDPNTAASHGTHTAGIMAASGNNRIGICGVAFGAKLLALKCGDNGGSDVAFGYEGIVYAADMGSKVVNNSWGGSNRSQVGQDIVDYASAKNCVVVAASGNDGIFEDFYPASFNHVLSVAAGDQAGNVTYFSNYNTHVDLNAPGNQVLSTVPGGNYIEETGTSMASPNASGSIAVVRQKYPLLNSDQAIERLRVTTDQLDSSHDAHLGFSGRGRINLKRAVSESPVFSARLIQANILDANGNDILESGEDADIVLHVRNYLSPLNDLVAKVEYLNGAGQYISANNDLVSFGKVNTLESTQNIQGSVRITVSKFAPSNYVVRARLSFIGSSEGYGPDIDYFSFVINKAYLDLNLNNLAVTFDAKGGIGYNDPPSNIQGSGFLWAKAPASISPQGRSILSQSGLMIASDTQHVVASAPSSQSDSYAEQDFTTSSILRYVIPPDHPNAIQELNTSFADVNIDSASQVGVRVDQKTYEFTKGYSANAVVIDYMIHKREVDSTIGQFNVTDATSAALFLDCDIGPSGSNNKSYISSLDSTLAITKRMEDLYPYVGIRLISEIPPGADLNFYALDNDGSNGSAKTYYGFSQNDKRLTMTTSRPEAGIGDVSMIYGLKNIHLKSMDSARMTLVIAMAENEQLLKQTVDDTRKEWLRTAVVERVLASTYPFVVSPNPFNSHIHLEWKSSETETKTFIAITDVVGRPIFSQITSGKQLDLNGLDLPTGAYTITLRQGQQVSRVQAVCVN